MKTKLLIGLLTATTIGSSSFAIYQNQLYQSEISANVNAGYLNKKDENNMVIGKWQGKDPYNNTINYEFKDNGSFCINDSCIGSYNNGLILINSKTNNILGHYIINNNQLYSDVIVSQEEVVLTHILVRTTK